MRSALLHRVNDAMSIQGNIETFYLSSLLQLLSNDRKTGILRVTEESETVEVYFRQGTIVFASGAHEEERLGYLLRSEALISKEQLDACLQAAKQRGEKLGKVLVDDKILTPDQLTDLVRRQVENILYNLFLWQHGSFEYTDTDFNLSNQILTDLDTMELVLEASRRIDEISVLEKQVPPHNSILTAAAPSRNTDQLNLNVSERAVLSLVDGERSVQEIINDSGYDDFSVMKILYSLISAGLVEADDSQQALEAAEAPASGAIPDLPGELELDLDQRGPEDASKPPGPEAPAPPAAPPLSDEPQELELDLDQQGPEVVPELPDPEAPAPQSPEQSVPEPLTDKPAPPSSPDLPAPEKETFKPAAEGGPPPPKGYDPGSKPEAFGDIKRRPGSLGKVSAPLSRQTKYLIAFVCVGFFLTVLIAFLLVKPGAPPSPDSMQPVPAQKAVQPKSKAKKKKPATTPPKETRKDAKKPPDVETPFFQDANGFLSINLPEGYELQDRSTQDKTFVVFQYPLKTKLTLKCWTQSDPWSAEDSMYKKILRLQGSEERSSSIHIDHYQLGKLSGCSSYAITLSNKRTGFSKVQLYKLACFEKMVSLEIKSRGWRTPEGKKLFNELRNSITRTLLIYP